MPIYVSKGGGGGGADDDAIHDNVAGEIAAIAEKTAPVAADMLIGENSAAANAKMMVKLGSLPLNISCRISKYPSTQTIAHNTPTAVLFGAEGWDTANMHSTVSNTSRMVAPSDGIYLAFGGILWADNATGYRIVTMTPSVGSVCISLILPGGNANIFGGGVFDLNAGDYVEAVVTQTSGGNLNVLEYSHAFMIKLADV